MSDRRRVPANGRVALAGWEGRVEAERFVEGTPRSVAAPLTDLRDAPDGRRERQLLFGEGVQVLDEADGNAFVIADRDGYVGYLDAAALGPRVEATHVVAQRATHLYPAPDIKVAERAALSFGSRLRVIGGSDRFYEVDGGGFVPRAHLRPANAPFDDIATIAQLFFGTPYLWGGNSSAGIDCSGLVQAACLACGVPCPGDSDLQEAELGQPMPPGTERRRGDLLFWKGHVAIMVDAEVMIHANAHHMAVAYEPAEAAIVRIESQGDGPVTAHRRL